MVKYHIGKNGTHKVCRAADGRCPYGAISDHFNSLEEAIEVADNLNSQLANPKSMGMAKVGGTQTVDKITELSIIRLANARQTLEKFEILRTQARARILETMDSYETKKVADPMVTISKVDASQRSGYDMEALQALPDYESRLTRDSLVREHVSLTTLPVRESSAPTLKTDGSNNLTFQDDGKGGYTLSESGMRYMKQLQELEAKVKEIEQTERALRDALMDRMKETGIQSIKVGGVGLDYKEEHNRKILDRDKLTDSEKETFGVKHDVAPSVRLKFKNA